MGGNIKKPTTTDTCTLFICLPVQVSMTDQGESLGKALHVFLTEVLAQVIFWPLSYCSLSFMTQYPCSCNPSPLYRRILLNLTATASFAEGAVLDLV